MPYQRISGSLSTPRVAVMIDMGHPFLNLTVDGFLKIGTVAAARAAAEEAYYVVKRGSISRHTVEHSLKKMCKEAAYWGTVAGVYVGMEYGAERIRGTRDWKNAMLGGALTGAIISSACEKSRDKIVVGAITGGAIATAAEFLNYLT
ncbi:outer envelope pore protein 16, chloroplastic-like [Vitis riparia]|uniref:outer envelope pore protein 16, chloroplastic-like n=1 Tax=Vitis riparia TaxID=96939 RepID=UPI00155B144D|nr:outer envelope pore protein 16, chloroplastic-like [Vitis riparia]XP_034689304.1 outer envelope pore protein 16, chloroplastic-like [Vitis riparia]